MEEGEKRARIGGALQRIGWLWGMLFVVSNFFNVGGTPLGDFLSFFGGNWWIPFALIFSGRVIKGRAGSPGAGEANEVGEPEVRAEPELGDGRQSLEEREAERREEAEDRQAADILEAARKRQVELDRALAELKMIETDEASGYEMPPIPFELPDTGAPMTSEQMLAEAKKSLSEES